ncbi:MAG: hypothetical protein Q8K75_05740 [Chlamydiales bacterium]|nr:hypothetical protein [Chlamydiales bacterium]
MKRPFAIFFFSFFLVHALVAGNSLEVNTSVDYFRGLPTGSWNGNHGALVAANAGYSLTECLDAQFGGSYGVYNWDGRGNLVFENPKETEQVGFLTGGASYLYGDWTAGLTYDRMYTKNFGIYALSPVIDQIRFQFGYTRFCEEFGLWGTTSVNTSYETALGIPTNFKAIGQLNLFWRHQFDNCTHTKLWIGMPYQDSLMFPGERAGNVILGFSFRVPLCGQVFIDGNGSYMAARKAPGVVQSRNYGFNMCLGLTYCFDNGNWCYSTPYMSIANHSNFFVDTNINQ